MERQPRFQFPSLFLSRFFLDNISLDSIIKSHGPRDSLKRSDFKFFDSSSRFLHTNRVISRRSAVFLWHKRFVHVWATERHLIRKPADEISSLYPVSSIWPFWETPIRGWPADRPGSERGFLGFERSLGKGKRRAGYEKKRERKERGRNGYKRDKGRSCNTHTWRASTTCPGLTPSPTGVMRCSSTCIRRSVGRWPSPRVELKNSLTKPGGLVFRATEFQRDLRALDLLFFFFFFFHLLLCFLSKILHGFIREKFGVVNGN